MTFVSDSAWTSIDGRVSPAAHAVLPLDYGLLRGDGCFETALICEGRVVALDLHLARLAHSLETLHIVADPRARRAELQTDVDRLLDQARLAHGVLRISTTAGLRLVEASPLPERVHLRRRGLDLHTLPEPRHDTLLARHKTLAWATHAIATRRHTRGTEPTFEGLWLDPSGHILEGTATNIFALVDGVAVTPPSTRPILPGIARARALLALPALGIPVAEADLTPDMLKRANGAFATSSLVLAAPISSYDGALLEPPPTELITAVRMALGQVYQRP